MALTKEQLLDLIDKNCTQQGVVSVPAPILRELVDNYIPTAAAAEVAESVETVAEVAVATAVTAADIPGAVTAAVTAADIPGAVATAVAAIIVAQPLIADIGDSATGAEIATAVNSLIDALQANGIVATS